MGKKVEEVKGGEESKNEAMKIQENIPADRIQFVT